MFTLRNFFIIAFFFVVIFAGTWYHFRRNNYVSHQWDNGIAVTPPYYESEDGEKLGKDAQEKRAAIYAGKSSLKDELGSAVVDSNVDKSNLYSK
jgi:hypothetical protein